MTFEEYLPYADLQLAPEKITQLRELYSKNKFKEFNFLLLEKCIQRELIQYDNVLDLMEKAVNSLESLNETVNEMPEFIKEARQALHGWKNNVRPSAGDKFFGDDTDKPAVLTHLIDAVRNSTLETIGLEENYREGYHRRITTLSKDGEEFIEYFRSDEEITKTVIKVLGSELEKSLNLQKLSDRGKE